MIEKKTIENNHRILGEKLKSRETCYSGREIGGYALVCGLKSVMTDGLIPEIADEAVKNFFYGASALTWIHLRDHVIGEVHLPEKDSHGLYFEGEIVRGLVGSEKAWKAINSPEVGWFVSIDGVGYKVSDTCFKYTEVWAIGPAATPPVCFSRLP